MNIPKQKQNMVLPAGAGVIPILRDELESKNSAPRRCGGDPIGKKYNQAKYLCSPQVRG